MANDAVLQARMDTELKRGAENLYWRMSTSTRSSRFPARRTRLATTTRSTACSYCVDFGKMGFLRRCGGYGKPCVTLC